MTAETPRIVPIGNGDIEVWNDGHAHTFSPKSIVTDLREKLHVSETRAASLRASLEDVTEKLAAFADFYQRCYMAPTTLKELKTGNEAEFINAIDESLRVARAALEASKTEVDRGRVMKELDCCTCGHVRDEHPHDPKYPSSTACAFCDCIAFEKEVVPSQDHEDA